MSVVTKFNSVPLSYSEVFLKDFEYPKVNWKYADMDYVWRHPETNQTLKQIIVQCPFKGLDSHKRTLIDVKVQNLTPQSTSCIPGWHLDGPSNPLHDSRPEIHHLYIHEIGGETEFIGEEFELTISKEEHQREITNRIPNNLKIAKAKAGHFATFSRFDFHRGIIVKKPMKRLLVRITETDTILPINKPYLKAVGSI